MSEWYSLVQNFAAQRIDQIEQHMNSNPDSYPVFTSAAKALDAELDELEAAHVHVFADHDELWMTYSAALAFEMYLAGARDGGRIYHALTTGELPTIQKQKEDTDEHAHS